MHHDEPELSGTEIAVIAMAGRFPGAPTLEQYWANIRDGIESVHFFTDEELLAAGEDPGLLADPAYVRAWPQLDGIEQFDAGFFGMSPRDASVMDPQHRIFLEVAWEAMERAGYSGKSAPTATGVFAATGMNHYMLYHVVPNAEIMRTVGEWLARHNGNDMNFLATRVAYQMNLKGPAMNVQTACSSSLTAIHLACQSLLNRETDLALAGASTLSLPQDRGYVYKPGEILTSDGHCRPFDAGSKGTLFGSGAGCVVLKRLDDALADGDTVLAVIRGTAINNDGSQKVGYLAPSVDGQARAVSEALAIAGVPADTIGLIEAHGTGTAVGDPIEVEALTQAYAPLTERKGFIALGSVKANIGHLGEAAGMAGFIKTVLAMRHETLPPSVNFTAPNPQIDFSSSPFFINRTPAPWPRGRAPRRAGVTSLGAGGTNAHLILEEAPAAPASAPPPRAAQLLTVSAKTRPALERACARLADHLDVEQDVSLADAAWTLHEGRTTFPFRRSVVARDAGSATTALREPQKGAAPPTTTDDARVIYMFPGGGAQYVSMGRDLYESEPVYRRAIDECLAQMPDALAGTLRRLVYPAAAAEVAAATHELEAPRFALPALFATEYATARLLSAWGVQPAGMIGHSMGEYVAACLAGVFTLRDGLTMVMERARLFETLPAGAMLSVELSEAELLPLLGPLLSIAAVNGPKLCVASGPAAEIDALQAVLQQREIESTRIHIAVAAHSAMLDPILAEFGRICSRVRFSAPTTPFISNLTGAWITPDEAMDPNYWVRHLRQTVRFGEGLQAVLASGRSVLVEVGPGRTLCSLARSQSPVPVAVPSLRHPKETASDVEFLLGAIGKVWEAGGRVQLSALHGDAPRRRVPLPTYPFERQAFWLEPGARGAVAVDKDVGLTRHHDVRDWFTLPTWHRSALRVELRDASHGTWLLFADKGGVAHALAALRPRDSTVLVKVGERFVRFGPTEYMVRADSTADIAALFEALTLDGRWPVQIAHLWGLDTPDEGWLDRWRKRDAAGVLTRAVGNFYVSQLCIVQAAMEQEQPLVLSTIASGLFSTSDADALPDPMKALLLGPSLVAPREAPHLQGRCIDVALGSTPTIEVATRLLHELQRPHADTVIALRPTARLVRRLDPVALDAAPPETLPVRQRATIMISGGLGGIGLEVAEHLATTVKARLILIGRTAIPERPEWEGLARSGRTDRVAEQARRLLAIEAAGGEVLPVKADVTDVHEMAGVVAMARERFGAIHGVIHSAGVIDDGLIPLKVPSAPTPVITVKAGGALVLAEVLRGESLDFFIAFSSVSSVLGLEGQVDYTSANAFLDAFVERMRRTTNVRALSIGWNAWREIGMTATLADGLVHPASRLNGRPGPHPDLERVAEDADGTLVYSTLFSRTRQWLLSEHVVRGGDALIPGTGYLELARAALGDAPAGMATELRHVTFFGPFVVGRSAPRLLRLRVSPTSDDGTGAREFAFAPDGESEPSVSGAVTHVRTEPERSEHLDTLRARLGAPQPIGGFLPQSFMDFGPRWCNVIETSVSGAEALIHLRLPDEFHADLATYRLHPALMDMATGGAQMLIPGFDASTDFYVPFSYAQIRIFDRLTAEVFSHVRYDASGSSADAARFDIDLYAATGATLVQIRGFSLHRLGAGARLNRASGEDSPQLSAAQRNLQELLRMAISPAEGMDAFDRILASGLSGHLLASSVDLPPWLARLDRMQQAGTQRMTAGGDTETTGFARPTLATSLVGPRYVLERELCEMWKQLLGVNEIGVHDDFFELGGQSLVAVRLFSKIRKHYRVDLPLSTLFEAPTIAQCAAIIAAEAGVRLVPITAESTGATDGEEVSEPGVVVVEAGERSPDRSARWRSLVVMRDSGQEAPFVCVAGMGGTLNNLRKLAMLLGDSRPFYGLQPPGADNPQHLLDSVEELASHYITELRREQPTGPYYLGGYSGGGVVAFEMARQLMQLGERVDFLGLIDTFSPALPRRSWGERALIHARRARRLGLRYLVDTIRRRAGAERGTLRLRLARRLGGVLPDEYRYDAIGASWLAAEARYRPVAQPLSATLLRAREESAISLWSGVRVDGQYGWGRYLLDGVDVELCPGNHTTMCEEPNVRVLATRMRAAIDAAAAKRVQTDGGSGSHTSDDLSMQRTGA